MTAAAGDDNLKTILVVGSCGLDRLLTVSNYPQPDDKIRTTSYCEVGGGNGSNSAHCMAALLPRRNPLGFGSSPSFRIQLGTKIGSDTVAETLQEEFRQAGVDLTSPLFKINPGTTTAFTTILVTDDGKEPTRTCIHTPGSCGELEIKDNDIPDEILDQVFETVVHFHSDARHTDVALALARESKRRGIPVSLDVEKDRGTVSLDRLMPLADMIFTNAGQIESYLDKLNREQLRELQLPDPTTPMEILQGGTTDVEVDSGFVAHILKPSMFFTRWYPEESTGKQIIITKGSSGSVHIQCDDIEQKEQEKAAADRPSKNKLTLTVDEKDSCRVYATHEYTVPSLLTTEKDDESGIHTTAVGRVEVKAKYTITFCGASKDVDMPIVDTTGAGDAFLGAYLLLSKQPWASVQTCLRFAAWVAGRKLGGPGARTGLPTAAMVQERLGDSPEQVESKLKSMVKSWSPVARALAPL